LNNREFAEPKNYAQKFCDTLFSNFRARFSKILHENFVFALSFRKLMGLKKEESITLAIFKEVKASSRNPFEESVDKDDVFGSRRRRSNEIHEK